MITDDLLLSLSILGLLVLLDSNHQSYCFVIPVFLLLFIFIKETTINICFANFCVTCTYEKSSLNYLDAAEGAWLFTLHQQPEDDTESDGFGWLYPHAFCILHKGVDLILPEFFSLVLSTKLLYWYTLCTFK